MTENRRTKSEQANTATWFFVGATFVLAGATAAASAGNHTVQYSGMALGLIILICGFVVLFRKRT